MTYIKITDKNGKPIDESNPLPVTGGGTGGSLEVDIIANSAGLATAQGQQDIVDAINNLSDASSEIYTDSVAIDDTGVQLPDLPIGEVIIQNDQDSGQDIYIGNDTDQELRLKPGEWISARITNLNLIYAKTTTGTATLRYFARSAAGIPGGGSSPVPVELTGSKVQKNDNVATGFSVAAGASARPAILDTEGYRRFTFYAEDAAAVNHTFQIGYLPRTSAVGGKSMRNAVTFATSTNTSKELVTADVISPATEVYIKNSDASSHNYNVSAYLFTN